MLPGPNRPAFFEDPQALDALKRVVYPELVKYRARSTAIRIWVPDCSTGEDVYSLAISFLEFLEEVDTQVPLRILGTDLTPDVLGQARLGTYPASIAENVSPVRLGRFFLAAAGTFTIRPEVRERCVFAKQDVTRDPPIARCDVISARGLVSLGAASQQQVLTTFHVALREPGFLISGKADTSGAFPGFAPLKEHAGIQRRTSHGPEAERGHVRSIIQKLQKRNRTLRAVNQEVAATNGNLRSTNEELQVSTEELRAAHEELESINAEVVARSADVARINDDLTNVLASVPVPIVIVGRDARVRRFNRIAETLFQLQPGDIGRQFRDTEAARRNHGLRDAVAEVLAQTRPIARTIVDECGRWHELHAVPYVTRDHHIDGAIVVTVDVDAVKRTALARAEVQTEYEFRGVLTAAPEAILVIDGAGRLTFANAKAQDMFGYDANEMNGMRVVEALAPERLHEDYARRLSECLAKAPVRAEGREPELYARRKDGTEFPIEFVIGSIVRDGGPLVVAFVTDITRRREAERSLRESQERLHQMAFDSAMAESRERRRIAVNLHDHLGQTLVLAQIKLASLREVIPGDVRASFDEAIDLLGRSVDDTRTLMFELSPPILHDLGLKEALAWLADELEQQHGLLVELTDDQADKPLDDAAAALVFRAVRELLLNVYKHAKADVAKVSLRRTGDCIAIEVEDRGVGFHPGSIEGGSPNGGFGLLSVRDQIRRLGGSVEITSAPRRGTRVCLQVPIKMPEALEVRSPS